MYILWKHYQHLGKVSVDSKVDRMSGSCDDAFVDRE